MDLLQTVRKEGSRGGRANFKWEDVKADQHRENYLGHSLMAPVGRWQKNRDLSWYARGVGNENISEEDARKEELRKVKEAESDALARALGYDVPTKPVNGESNPNTIEVTGDKGFDTQQKIAESLDSRETEPVSAERPKSERRRHRRSRSREHHHHRYRDRRRERTGEKEAGRRHRYHSRSRSPSGSRRHRRSRSRERDRDSARYERRRYEEERQPRYHDDKLRRRSRSPSRSRDHRERNGYRR